MLADTPTAAASSNVRFAGFAMNWSSLAAAYSAKAPGDQPNTSSPGWRRCTSLPMASIVPATSVPGIRFLGLRSPVARRMRKVSTCHQDPVADVDRRRVDANEDLVAADLGLRDLAVLQDLG